MSTSYYRIKKPFTSLRTEDIPGAGYTDIGIWVNHAKAGVIVVRNEEVADVLMAFRRSVSAVAQSGIEGGHTVLDYDDDDVEDDTPLISDCGELTTVVELKAKGAVER